MKERRYVVMGAGEVGRYLARSLSADGHNVVLIDSSAEKQKLAEDQLDVAFVLGNGSHIPTLQAAQVDRCDLFVAASSSARGIAPREETRRPTHGRQRKYL